MTSTKLIEEEKPKIRTKVRVEINLDDEETAKEAVVKLRNLGIFWANDLADIIKNNN